MDQSDISELVRTSQILPKFSWNLLNLDIWSMYHQFLIKFEMKFELSTSAFSLVFSLICQSFHSQFLFFILFSLSLSSHEFLLKSFYHCSRLNECSLLKIQDLDGMVSDSKRCLDNDLSENIKHVI